MQKPLINQELVRICAYLPDKLSALSKVNAEQAVNLLQDWGDGKKPLRILWQEVNELLDAATPSNC